MHPSRKKIGKGNNGNNSCTMNNLKGALSGLRSFVATESPLKMMKNSFYFTSKTLLVLKIFNFLC